MKDPVFAGKDVAEAVHVASRTLAVAEGALRYVVLDPGQPGGRGLSPTQARIAVLLDRGVGEAAGRGEAEDAEEIEAARERGRRARRAWQDPEAEEHAEESGDEIVRAIVEEMARCAGVELWVRIQERRDVVDVTLGGEGASIFFDAQGDGLEALEHLLDRLFAREGAGRRVRLKSEGYREYRDEILRSQALELAAEVRRDGQPRMTLPLNAYERRVIHLTLEGDVDLTTFSVGEGHGRRVTVAPRYGSDATEGAATGGSAAEAPAAPGSSHEEFDYKKFDRPPQDGGGDGLM